MAVIEKSSVQHPDTVHPYFGEIVKHGAKQGVYVGRKGNHHYLIQWDGEKHSQLEPAGCIVRTRKSNNKFLETFERDEVSQHTSSKMGDIRRRGGLKTGTRPKKKLDPEQEPSHENPLTKGNPLKSMHSREDDVDKVACLNCGRQIKPDYNNAEPYRCSKCKSKSAVSPIFHNPTLKV